MFSAQFHPITLFHIFPYFFNDATEIKLQKLPEHAKTDFFFRITTNDNEQTNNISERVPAHYGSDIRGWLIVRNSSVNGTAEEVQMNEPPCPRT